MSKAKLRISMTVVDAADIGPTEFWVWAKLELLSLRQGGAQVSLGRGMANLRKETGMKPSRLRPILDDFVERKWLQCGTAADWHNPEPPKELVVTLLVGACTLDSRCRKTPIPKETNASTPPLPEKSPKPVEPPPAESTDSSEVADAPSEPPYVPRFLQPLQLYSQDTRLCGRWKELVAAWEQTYNGEGDWVADEILKAHSWEVGNPSRRKRDRPKFLTNWLNRAWDKRRG